jgi:hypothetical protein
MLEYLVTSRARRELLRRLWLDGDRGNVSQLARACGSYSQVGNGFLPDTLRMTSKSSIPTWST